MDSEIKARMTYLVENKEVMPNLLTIRADIKAMLDAIDTLERIVHHAIEEHVKP